MTGYLENQIRQFVATEYPNLKVNYIYNDVYATTNNIYSLWLTKDSMHGEAMLLMDSDIVFDKKIIEKLLTSHYDNCLALKRHDVGEEEIKVKVNKKGRVLEISKQVVPTSAVGLWWGKLAWYAGLLNAMRLRARAS